RERRHVDHEVPQQRKVVERAHRDSSVAECGQARPAGPALAPVDDHAARAAHPDAAGIAEREARILPALDLDQRVEHSGVAAGVDGILLPALVVARRPPEHAERDDQSLPTKSATAPPISAGEPSWMKCTPRTVNSR